MPRPKVPAQNRQRAIQACQQCRSSKKRCNGQRPCATCIRKNKARNCRFADAPPASTPVQSADQEDGLRMTEDGESEVQPSSTDNSGRVSSQSQAAPFSLQPPSPETSHRTQPRLLESSMGERVFFGESAPLAFLQLLRDVVAQSLGSSDFSHYARRNQMLEGSQSEAEIEIVPVSELLLTPEQESRYLDLSLNASRGLIEIWSKDQVQDILERYRAGSLDQNSLELAIAQIHVAIGAQCSKNDRLNLLIDKSYFAQAKKQAWDRMIHPSLDTIQIFLLIAFYLLGACERNSAYMCVGIAARAAYVLGLHYENRDSEPALDKNNTIRKMTWESLVTIDTVVSSLLGRPSATSTHQKTFEKASDLNNLVRSSNNAAMHASYSLACILDEKVQKLYHVDKVTGEGARACLSLLRDWSARLPTELRRLSSSLTGADVQGQMIGNLHVSCFYYFAVMLVSRPFLIQHLTNRLAAAPGKPGSRSTGTVEEHGTAEIEEIATVCLDAAVYMIQTCQGIHRRDMLPDNMRVLKAWVFAAGLILGFDMFTVQKSSGDIENAFRGSCSILQMLSPQSVQATHYSEILASLSDAIIARRVRRTPSKSRRIDKPTVERIMTFDAVDPSPSHDRQSSFQLETPDPSSVISRELEGMNAPDQFSDIAVDLDFQTMMNEPFLNWGSTDFMSWNQFT